MSASIVWVILRTLSDFFTAFFELFSFVISFRPEKTLSNILPDKKWFDYEMLVSNKGCLRLVSTLRGLDS